jgi:hypothetical protein
MGTFVTELLVLKPYVENYYIFPLSIFPSSLQTEPKFALEQQYTQ